MTEPVRLRVRNHGATQVEFKIDYELSAARETRYTVNTYIFVPHSLGISRRTYFNNDFYRDIQNYVRLRTPSVLLENLTTDPMSPLLNSEQILEAFRLDRSQENQEQLVTNIKLNRPVLNASLRAHLRTVLRRRRHATNAADMIVELEHALDAVMIHGRDFIDRFRLLEGRLVDRDGADRVFTAFRLVDEAVSLVYEDALLWSFRIAEKYLDQGGLYRERIGQEITREVEYRKSRNYKSILRAGTTNERFLQIRSFLKKYTTSVLYLSTSTEREGTMLEQVSFSIAAGLSMIFATVIAFYSQAQYGVLTFPVFVALVVGYMFKDRIKELGRELSAKLIRNIRHDQRTTLYTPDGKDKIGYLREKMTFINRASLPEVIRDKREQQATSLALLENRDEEILFYAKEVAVKRAASTRFSTEGSGITGIRDIMRYDIRRYLRKTADPVEQRSMLIDGKLVAVDCHKTYQVEFITEYRSSNDEEHPNYHRAIVYLDRDGILNIRHTS